MWPHALCCKMVTFDQFFFPSLTDAGPYMHAYIDTCISQCSSQFVYDMLLFVLPALIEPRSDVNRGIVV